MTKNANEYTDTIMNTKHCISLHSACLATISKQYGFSTSINRIREVAGTDKQRTNAYGVIKAAEKLGFSAKGVKGDKEAFFSEFPLPCIAHVIVDGGGLLWDIGYWVGRLAAVVAEDKARNR